MNKNRIRLTESQLHRVIKESVKKVLRENNITPQYSVYVDGELGYSTNNLDDAYRYADKQLCKYAEYVSIWDNISDEEVDICE